MLNVECDGFLRAKSSLNSLTSSNNELGPEERSRVLEGLHVNDAGRLVEAVGHRLKVGAHGRNLLAGELVTVGEVAWRLRLRLRLRHVSIVFVLHNTTTT